MFSQETAVNCLPRSNNDHCKDIKNFKASTSQMHLIERLRTACLTNLHGKTHGEAP